MFHRRPEGGLCLKNALPHPNRPQRQRTRLAAASISVIDAMTSSKLGAVPKIMEVVLA